MLPKGTVLSLIHLLAGTGSGDNILYNTDTLCRTSVKGTWDLGTILHLNNIIGVCFWPAAYHYVSDLAFEG